MSVSQGSYTFGKVTSDYATWELAIADLAFPLTGDLTLTGEANATITTGFFVDDVDLNGHTLTFDGGGYSYELNAAEALFRIDEPRDNNSQVIIQNWKVKRIIDASPTSRGIVHIYRPNKDSQTFIIRDCSFDLNNYKGHGILLIYNRDGLSATTYITNVVIWDGTSGTDNYGNSYAGIMYWYQAGISTYVNCDAENVVIYDCEGIGFEVGSGQGDLENVACFDNGTDYANTGGLNLFLKDASSDATGSEAGLRNLTAADCFESLTDTDEDFLYPKTTGDLYGAGANVSISGHTQYYNDVTIIENDVDIGAYGIERDYSTEETQYAVFFDAGIDVTDTDYGCRGGRFRLITGRPGYTGAATPTGDSIEFSIDLDGTESIGTAFQSGQLYSASNDDGNSHYFKTASSVPEVGTYFIIEDTNDFTGGELATAKGAALAAYDVFKVTNNTSGSEAVEYAGSNIWDEGILIKNGIGTPERNVELESTGDYGTLSGFDFSVKNSNLFWEFCESNDIYLGNIDIYFFVVIDGYFYYQWSGVINSEIDRERSHKIICRDNFKKIHKMLPPRSITKTEYSDADSRITGDAFPICFGDIPYAILKAVNGNQEFEVIDTYNAEPVKIFFVYTGYYMSDNYWYYAILTKTRKFVADELNGKYIYVFSGENSNSYLGRKIHDTLTSYNESALGWHTTVVKIASVPDIDQYNFDSNGYNRSDPTNNEVGADTWLFQLAGISSRQYVSLNEISSYREYDEGQGVLSYYNEDKNDYEDISQIVKERSTSDATIDVTGNVRGKDDEVCEYLYFPLGTSPISVIPAISDNGLPSSPDYTTLYDLDRTTYFQSDDGVSPDWWGFAWDDPYYKFQMDFTLQLPDSIIGDDKLQNIYLAPDFDLLGIKSGASIRIELAYRCRGDYGLYNANVAEYNAQRQTWSGFDDHTKTYIFNYLPNEYYNDGDDNSENTYFGKFALYSLTADSLTGDGYNVNTKIISLDGDNLNMVKNGNARQINVSLYIRVSNNSPEHPRIRIKQLGFAAQKLFPIYNSLYATVCGELVSSQETNNVYRTFEHILETYDEIDSSNIDYGNLSDERKNWKIGRQITEQKNSFEYLRELCKHSFVALFPTRAGKRGLNAWIDADASGTTHGNSDIIQGSVENWKKTDARNIYNVPVIRYAWSPGPEKYTKSMFIAKISESSFPAIDGDWQEYAGGMGGYGDAKYLWDACHTSYEKYRSENELPAELSELPWFIDYDVFNGINSITGTAQDTAYMYFSELINWCTQQKYTCEYRIPISKTNALLELTDKITFTDVFYTNNTTVNAWVTGIGIDTEKDEIIIRIITDVDDVGIKDIIVETGDAPDIITESGSQPDTITETGV